jgi:hypothetical protein
MQGITLDFLLKLLDKGFSVAVAVICLMIMWKALPIFSVIKMFMIENKEFCYNNQKVVKTTTEVIQENTDVIKKNNEVLTDVKDILKN